MYSGKNGAYKACDMTGSAVTYSATDHSAYVVTRRTNGSVKVQRDAFGCEPVIAEYPSMKQALLALYSNPLHLGDWAVWHPFSW